MREGGSAARPGALLLTVVLTLAGLEPRMEGTAPPADAGSSLRAAIRNECIAVELPPGGTLRVWPARRVRASRPPPAGESRVARDRVQLSIQPGSLVAVASWDSPWIDYRGQTIPAGLYALVYAIQPQFKRHVGVSEFRDAALLVRPADARPGRDLAALVSASRRVSGTSHPAVAALFAVAPDAAVPRLSARANGGMTLEFAAGNFRIGLALEGTGKVGETEP